MSTHRPRLTIGVPVYNGELYLRQALDSLLQQTFTDFEILISDNASVDNTAAICQEFMRRDPRVRYIRQDHNIGAAENFNTVYRMARGEYFKWAAHDDILHPEFLEKCVAILDQNPSVILAYSKVNRIDSTGEMNGSYDYRMRVDDPHPDVRFADLILINHFCLAIFGVIRTGVLRQTPLIGHFVGSDRTLLAELGLRGRFIEIPEYLFNRRDHPLASTRAYRHHRRLQWFDPRQRVLIHLPYWRTGAEYMRAALKVPLSPVEKGKSIFTVMRWFIARRRVLIEDLKGVVVQFFPYRLTRFANIGLFGKKTNTH